jgi:hypothetical protein
LIKARNDEWRFDTGETVIEQTKAENKRKTIPPQPKNPKLGSFLKHHIHLLCQQDSL